LLNTDCMHRQIAWTGFYDLELSRRMAALARTGGVLVDVGTNIGYFTCLWAALNPNNTVYAFEPSPRNLQLLRQNQAAQSGADRIKIHDVAVGKQEGSLPFDVGPDEQTGWGGLATQDSHRTIQVEVYTAHKL